MKKISMIAIATIAVAFLLSMTPFPSMGQDMAIAAARVVSVNVLNWPAIQNTAEQNLDVNGDIKVHEQGEVTVNGAVDVSNLPLDANGNIKVAESESSDSTIVTIFEDFSGLWHTSSAPVSTDGYEYASLLGKATSGSDCRLRVDFETETGERISLFSWSYTVSTGGLEVNTHTFPNWDPLTLAAALRMQILGPYMSVEADSGPDGCGGLTVKAYLTR